MFFKGWYNVDENVLTNFGEYGLGEKLELGVGIFEVGVGSFYFIDMRKFWDGFFLG